jgi:hypothetical protein
MDARQALAQLRSGPEEIVVARDVYKPGQLIIVSYGAGLDSTAMLVEMHNRKMRPDLILFADTGGERPETYEYIKLFDVWLESVGFPRVTVCKYEPKKVTYDSLETKCLTNGTFPSLAYGGGFHSCALVFKAAVQVKYERQWAPGLAATARGEKILHVIGYDDGVRDRKRADKARKVRSRHRAGIEERASRGLKPLAEQWEVSTCDETYLLQDWGLAREALPAIIEAAGLPVPRKSCCFFCPAMQPEEVVELRNEQPELFKRALALEEGAQAKLREGARGMAMGRWYWKWLKDVTDPAMARDAIRAMGGKVGKVAALRP